MGFVVIAMNFVTDWRIAVALLIVIGALGGFFVVPMNALLQHRGHLLMGAGHSIAVQNFNENLCIFAMLGLSAGMSAAGLSIHTIIIVFGLMVSGAMTALYRRHGHDQDDGSTLALAATAAASRAPQPQSTTGASGSSLDCTPSRGKCRRAVHRRRARPRSNHPRNAPPGTPIPCGGRWLPRRRHRPARGCRDRPRSRRRDPRAAGRSARRCSVRCPRRGVRRTPRAPDRVRRAPMSAPTCRDSPRPRTGSGRRASPRPRR
jgi:hypothetical protein